MRQDGTVRRRPVANRDPGSSTIVLDPARDPDPHPLSDPDPAFVSVMACRDRTAEFGAAVGSLRGAGSRRPGPGPPKTAPPSLAAYSEFMRDARVVSKNVAAAYSKLERLAALANKRSLFDDRPAEIQELTYIIKNDLGSLNRQIARLGDAPRGRRHVRSHSSNVVLALQSRLASVSADFKRVLEVRSENLRRQNARRETFAGGAPAPVSRTSALALAREQDERSQPDERTSPRPPLAMQAVVYRDESDDYAAVRAETMQNIESTVVELGGIFQQLAHMVKEQDETITRIDANVENAELNVEAAHAQILAYFRSVSGNRMLMFKIFGVLIFFFIFFAIFLS